MQEVKVLNISSPQIVESLIKSLRVNDIRSSMIGPALYMNGMESHISSLTLLDSCIVFHMDDSLLTDFLVRSFSHLYGPALHPFHGNWQELRLSKDGFISSHKLFLLRMILKLFHLRIQQTGNMKLLFDVYHLLLFGPIIIFIQ